MLQRLLPWIRSKRTWVLLLLFGLLAAIAGHFLWVEHLLRAARHDLERRAYHEAQAHLASYLRTWPNSTTAHLLAVRCARGVGDLDEAERLLAACPQRGADYESVAMERSLLYAQRGTLAPEGVERLWRRVEQQHPETPRILEALTLGAIYTQRLGAAMECVERWLAYTPGDSQALYLRGLVWEGMGALQKAGDDYRQAVRHDPEHALARQRLAEYLTYIGEYQEAAELFEHLLAQQPDDAMLLLGLARCRRLHGEIAQAEQLLDQVLARDSPPVPALVERAGLAQEKREFNAAENWFRQALARDPFDRDGCHGLGQCLRALDRPLEAETYETRRAQIDRDLESLAKLCEEMGKNPNDADLPYQAGMICLRNGQKAEARRWFRNVLQHQPQHNGALRGLEEAVQH
jgi:tetratricopeptide (TPR) repeat protein